jgi:hypothetical protein
MSYGSTGTKAPIGTTARTGERCPESGVWRVVTSPSTTAPIAKGDVMPPYGSQAVTWILQSYA